jgi:RelA/SpoT family protein
MALAPFWFRAMKYAVPQYSADRVNKAGELLVRPKAIFDVDETFEIINNWRSSHAFPLNTFYVTLKGKARKIDSSCIVSQRIKRLRAITDKLSRLAWLTLSEMQDIGGCRAVVSSVNRVYRLVEIYKRSDIKHTLIDEDDYIEEPKPSGYRSYHLIYKYKSDRKHTYNICKIEMQLRSTLQHAWATAVEVVGTHTRQALKSSQGPKDWLRFFKLMSTAIALREKTTPVPDTPTDATILKKELRDYAQRLHVIDHLQAYGAIFDAPDHLVGTKYFLLELNFDTHRISVRPFRGKDLETASKEYLAVERAEGAEHQDAVLVSVDSLQQLRNAYPNYFLDTHKFLAFVRKTIQ